MRLNAPRRPLARTLAESNGRFKLTWQTRVAHAATMKIIIYCRNNDVVVILSWIFNAQEFQIAEQPSIITLIESAGNTDTYSICVGYKHQFDIINDGSGTAHRLFAVQEGTKAHLVSATDLYEDEEPELLLCYNSTFFHYESIFRYDSYYRCCCCDSFVLLYAYVYPFLKR